jgi:hypothetical protein
MGVCAALGAFFVTGQPESISWRNLIAACAAVCVFRVLARRDLPLLSLNMEADGVSPRMIGFNTAMAPIGILVAGPVHPAPLACLRREARRAVHGLRDRRDLLLYPTIDWLPAWFVLRFTQGVTVATLFALSEAWVLTSATGKWRGLIVGAYATCISATFGVGAAVIGWVGIEGYLPFVIGAIVLCLAALPMSMLTAEASEANYEHVSMLTFLPKAPMLLGAIFVHAIFDGGMLAFLSVYGVRSGLSVEAGAVLITALSFGNVFFQIPIGLDRRQGRQDTDDDGLLRARDHRSRGLAVYDRLDFGLAADALSRRRRFRHLHDRPGPAGRPIPRRRPDRRNLGLLDRLGPGRLAGSVVCGLAMNQFGPTAFRTRCWRSSSAISLSG